jgi:flavin reductase (DIM6/NTAB) family NADH-FMN oxidoreductase RutF
MQVHISNAGTITLRESERFNALEVLVDLQPPEVLAQALARLGQREGEQHVRIAPSVLRFLSGHAGQAVWEAGFAAMLAGAARHGWVNEHGEVRAHLVCRSEDTVVSVQDFKAAMRALPAGITAITTAVDGAVGGMIVSSLSSISAEPPLVGFFVHQDASLCAPLMASGRFVANVLGESHGKVMASFLAEPQGEARFKTGQWTRSEQGQPVLQDALASMECDMVFTQALGTHHLMVGKVRQTTCSQASPMVYFNAATHHLAPRAAALAA